MSSQACRRIDELVGKPGRTEELKDIRALAAQKKKGRPLPWKGKGKQVKSSSDSDNSGLSDEEE
jgi:hypothetical protein